MAAVSPTAAPLQKDAWTPPSTFKPRPLGEFLPHIINAQKFSEITFRVGSKDRWFQYWPIRRTSVYSGSIDFGSYRVYAVYGVEGSGKGGLIGNIGSQYPKYINMHDAEDGEGLAIFRARRHIDKFQRCLLIGHKDTRVVFSKEPIRYVPINLLSLEDLISHDAVVLDYNMFPTPSHYFQAFQHLVEVIKQRRKITEHWFAAVNEASSLVSMALVQKGMSADQARTYIVQLVRTMRHRGAAIGLDAQYLGAVIKEMRGFARYTFFKNMGGFDLTDDMSWAYGWLNYNEMRDLREDEFAAIDRYGGVYAGVFRRPPWHMEPEEDIYGDLGIEFQVGAGGGVTNAPVPQSDGEAGEYERTQMHKALKALKDRGLTYEQVVAVYKAQTGRELSENTAKYHLQWNCKCERRLVEPEPQIGVPNNQTTKGGATASTTV